MAETLDYKVNIDTTNVADQLSRIKNQVDQAMATFSFRSSIPDVEPTAFNVASPIGISASQTMGSAMTTAQQNAMSFMDSTRLGFHKFMVDAQTLALQTPLGVSPLAFDPSQRWMPSFSGSPVGSAFKSLTGVGYDPAMSISPGDYSRLAAESGRRNILGGIGNVLAVGSTAATVTAIGAELLGAGAIAFPAALAAIPLGAADLIYNGFMNTAGYDIQPMLNLRNFAQDTSWRSLAGRLSYTQASGFGLAASNMHRSDFVMGDRLGGGDVERIMREVTESGGFDFARTAEDFTNKLKTQVESVRKVMHMLNASEADAVRTMTQWSNMGIGTTAGTIEMGLHVGAQALAAGYSSSEFLQFGTQTAEMLRGTGVSMLSGYLGGMNALTDVRQMARNGTLPQELVQQMGGFQNIAALMVREGTQWGLSTSGLMQQASQAFYGTGYNPYQDPLKTMIGAAAQLSTPQAWYEAVGAQARNVSTQPANELYGQKVSALTYEFELAMKTQGLKFNRDAYVGYMIDTGNMDNVEGNLAFDYIMNTQKRNRNQNNEETQRQYMTYNNSPAWSDVLIDRTGRYVTQNIFHTQDFARMGSEAMDRIEYGWNRLQQGLNRSLIHKSLSSNYISSALGDYVRNSTGLGYIGTADPANKYRKEIEDVATKYGYDPMALTEQTRIESNFDPNVVSEAGAQGMTQILPENFAEYGITNINDPKQALGGMVQYMQKYEKLYSAYGPEKAKLLALVAYHSGPGHVVNGEPVGLGPRGKQYIIDYYKGMDKAKNASDKLAGGDINNLFGGLYPNFVNADPETSLVNLVNEIMWNKKPTNMYGAPIYTNSRPLYAGDLFRASNDPKNFTTIGAEIERIMMDMDPESARKELASIAETRNIAHGDEAASLGAQVYTSLVTDPRFKQAVLKADASKLLTSIMGPNDTATGRQIYMAAHNITTMDQSAETDYAINRLDRTAVNAWITAVPGQTLGRIVDHAPTVMAIGSSNINIGIGKYAEENLRTATRAQQQADRYAEMTAGITDDTKKAAAQKDLKDADQSQVWTDISDNTRDLVTEVRGLRADMSGDKSKSGTTHMPRMNSYF